MSSRSVILFVLIVGAGFLYRMFMVSHASAEIRWDAQSYGNIAKGMMENPLFVDCCQKAAGYPAFLAVVYSLFGVDNHTAVAGIQSALDLFSAIVLFAISRRFFTSRAALVVLILSLFHPFAASYVGFQLPETLTMFLLISMMWVVTHRRFSQQPFFWLLFGVLLGLIVWVRLSFYYFVFLALGISAVLFFRSKKRFLYLTVAVLGFILASFHSLISYKTTFNTWSLVPPYTMGMPAALYMSYFMGRYPELISQHDSLNRLYYDINLEYNTTHFTQNSAFREKYRVLFFEKLQAGFGQLVWNSLRNVYWMWDMNHLFVYEDPWYPADQIPVRAVNLAGLILCAAGMLRYAKERGQGWVRNPALFFTILVFGYITIFFAPITNETRYIIPIYPVVLFWAGYAIYEYYPFRRS